MTSPNIIPFPQPEPHCGWVHPGRIQAELLAFPAQNYIPNLQAAEQELDAAWAAYSAICRRSWVLEDNADRYQSATARVDNAISLLRIVRRMLEDAA